MQNDEKKLHDLGQDYISETPDEIKIGIINYLELSDSENLFATSKRWLEFGDTYRLRSKINRNIAEQISVCAQAVIEFLEIPVQQPENPGKLTNLFFKKKANKTLENIKSVNEINLNHKKICQMLVTQQELLKKDLDVLPVLAEIEKTINQLPEYGYEQAIEKLCQIQKYIIENISSINLNKLIYVKFSSPEDARLKFNLKVKVALYTIKNDTDRLKVILLIYEKGNPSYHHWRMATAQLELLSNDIKNQKIFSFEEQKCSPPLILKAFNLMSETYFNFPKEDLEYEFWRRQSNEIIKNNIQKEFEAKLKEENNSISPLQPDI